MSRRRDRERVEIRRTHRSVVSHGEVLEPAPVVADLDRRARQELALNGGAKLPVRGPHSPAVKDLLIDRRALERTAERRRQPWPALTAGRRVHQIAVGHEIAIGVVPVPVGRSLEPRRLRRVVDRVSIPEAGALEVLAEIDLEGSRAVAEDVVGRAQTRRDVVEPSHRIRARKRQRLGVEPVWRVPPVVVRGRVTVRMVEPDRGLHREAAVPPLLLCIERVKGRPVRCHPVADVHRQAVRNTVVELIRQAIFVPEVRVLEHVVRALVPELHVVCAGHERQRGPPRIGVLPVLLPPRETAVRESCRHSVQASLLRDGNQLHKTGRCHDAAPVQP